MVVTVGLLLGLALATAVRLAQRQMRDRTILWLLLVGMSGAVFSGFAYGWAAHEKLDHVGVGTFDITFVTAAICMYIAMVLRANVRAR